MIVSSAAHTHKCGTMTSMLALPMTDLARAIAPVVEAIGAGMRWLLSRDDRTVGALTNWRDALRRMNDKAAWLVERMDSVQIGSALSEEPIDEVRKFETGELRDIAGALRFVAMGLRQNTGQEQGLSGFAVLRATNAGLMAEVDRELRRSAELAEELLELAEDWGDTADAIDAIVGSDGRFIPHEEAMRSVGLRQ